jgi:hypothetical protein
MPNRPVTLHCEATQRGNNELFTDTLELTACRLCGLIGTVKAGEAFVFFYGGVRFFRWRFIILHLVASVVLLLILIRLPKEHIVRRHFVHIRRDWARRCKLVHLVCGIT